MKQVIKLQIFSSGQVKEDKLVWQTGVIFFQAHQ